MRAIWLVMIFFSVILHASVIGTVISVDGTVKKKALESIKKIKLEANHNIITPHQIN